MKSMKNYTATNKVVTEATDLYNKGGIQITRYSAGKGNLGVQISTGFKKYIQVTEPQMKTLASILPKLQKELRKDLKANNMDPSDDAEQSDDDEMQEGYYKDKEIKKQDKKMGNTQEAGNAFTMALKAAREKGDDTFVVAGKKYKCEDFDDDGVIEDASNDKSDDGEGLDKVNPKSAKKKFADRKDKDIDNDGDVDDSDKFLHKRRKAIGKSMKDEPKGEKDETAKMSPKKESTIRSRLLSIWEDAAGANRKKDQNRDKGGDATSGSAKKMKDGHPINGDRDNITDYDEKGHDDATKAGRVVKAKAKARNSGDATNSGDQNVINKVKEAYASMYNKD